jgi:hypothetical protein
VAGVKGTMGLDGGEGFAANSNSGLDEC